MLEQEHEDSQQFSKAQYVISYTAAEFSRLNQQADLVTNAEGGICPELEDLSGIQTLFDAACGPGSWAIMAADLYPDIHVIGGDIHPQYLVHARERAQRLGLSNIDFHTIDITKTLPFADDSVDLANARFIQSVLTKEVWLSFLKEMVRIVRPGGFIRLTEGAFVESNSLSFNRIQAFLSRALVRSQRSFLPSEELSTNGMGAMLGWLLRQAGCRDIQYRSFILDYSSEARGHESSSQHFRITFDPQTLGPLITAMGLTTLDDYRVLYEQAMKDVASSSFAALGSCITILGQV